MRFWVWYQESICRLRVKLKTTGKLLIILEELWNIPQFSKGKPEGVNM